MNNCKTCGKKFKQRKDRKQKFCSVLCYGESLRTLPRYLFCTGCGKRFKRPHRQGRKSKYCSWKCYLEHRVVWNKKTARIEKGTPCPVCGNPTCKRNRRTCGKEKCIRLFLSGYHKEHKIKPPSQKGKKWGIDYPIEHHNWWRGGISDLRHQIYGSTEWKIWRKSVFERDDYTCQLCGKRGYKLQVDHHLVPFAVILKIFNIETLKEAKNCKILWETKNGRVLCRICHQNTETYGGRCKLILKKTIDNYKKVCFSIL